MNKSFIKGLPIHPEIEFGTVKDDDLNIYNYLIYDLHIYNQFGHGTFFNDTNDYEKDLNYINKYKEIKEKQIKHVDELFDESFKKVSGLRKLESNFLTMEEYYYNSFTNKIMALDVFTGKIKLVDDIEKKHILDFNTSNGFWNTIKPFSSELTNYNKDSKYEKIYTDIIIRREMVKKSTFI
jgi:hypothetical protein